MTTTPNTSCSTTRCSPTCQRVEKSLFALFIAACSFWLWNRYHTLMDGYEIAILCSSAAGLAWAGWQWRSARILFVALILSLGWTYVLYGGSLKSAETAMNPANQRFMLKYFFASQTAIMWMCSLAIMAAIAYWIGLLTQKRFLSPETNRFVLACASGLTWGSVYFGFLGLLVRWIESYQLGADIGHIPVSNLYEVSILFCLVTMLMMLYYEQKNNLRTLGPFVMLIVVADVIFTLWYAVDRQAYTIQPLIPALQSWWMKIHVPANFIGYGAFAATAMLAVPHLLSNRPALAPYLPPPEKLETIMYRLVALGFVGFTIATILGALWAAEAWGTYWQWDPKETWAFIVWLNYAAWLHIRHIRAISSRWLSWWAIIGLFITAFAFYGVNMFLSGLHSYGTL